MNRNRLNLLGVGVIAILMARAGIIRPSDVPARAPSQDAMKREECT